MGNQPEAATEVRTCVGVENLEVTWVNQTCVANSFLSVRSSRRSDFRAPNLIIKGDGVMLAGACPTHQIHRLLIHHHGWV